MRLFADTRPLKYVAFRRLWLANIVTVIGAQMTVVAIPAQIFHITGSSAYVGLAGAFGLVPLVVFGLWGGSLADVIDRLLPYWYDRLVPELTVGRTVLVVAHGNSLRALVKHLDGISDADITGLNIPTGIPLVYQLDDDNQPVEPGRYLDPEAAAAGAAAVAAQGKK